MKSPKKKAIASKMVSKEYTNVRCGHCGKFGHHHSEHMPTRTNPLHGAMHLTEAEWQHGLKTGSFPDVIRGREMHERNRAIREGRVK